MDASQDWEARLARMSTYNLVQFVAPDQPLQAVVRPSEVGGKWPGRSVTSEASQISSNASIQ